MGKKGKIELDGGSDMDRGATLYDIWKVKIGVRNVIYGGVPKSEKIIRGWLDTKVKNAIKAGHDIDPKMPEKEVKEILGTVDVSEDSTWCGFKEFYQGENVGPYLDGYNFKACFREGATQTGATLMRWSNNRGFKQHYQHGVHMKAGDGKSDIIRLGEIAGQEEFVGHVMTAKGQKSVLSRHDFVSAPLELEYQIWSLATGILDDDMVRDILLACQEVGLGAARSREMSKFDLLDLERIQIGEIAHYNKATTKKAAKK